MKLKYKKINMLIEVLHVTGVTHSLIFLYYASWWCMYFTYGLTEFMILHSQFWLHQYAANYILDIDHFISELHMKADIVWHFPEQGYGGLRLKSIKPISCGTPTRILYNIF